MRKTLWTTLIPALALSLAGTFLSGNLLSSHIGGRAGGLLAGLCGEQSRGCDTVLSSRWAVFPPAAEEVTQTGGGRPERQQTSPPSAAAADDYDVSPPDRSPAETADAGVPVALLGLWYFCFVTVWLLFVGRPSWARRLWHLVPMLVCVAGCAMSVWFIVVMAWHIGAWCPLCLGTHVVNFGLVLFVLLAWPVRPAVPAPAEETTAALGADAFADAEDQTGGAVGAAAIGAPGHPSFRLVLTAAVLGVALCAGAWQFSKAATLRAENAVLADAVEELRGDADLAMLRHFHQQKKALKIRPDDPIIPARPGKRMTLVLFSDLQCPHCLRFERKLAQEILPLFEGHLRLVFKHYPLCQECNRFARSNMHPLACEAAYLVEAARLRGGSLAFWRIKGHLAPRSQPWTSDDLAAMAAVAGLDAAQLEADRHSDAVKARVREDIELAKSLGVDATPAVFLNGRLVAPLSRDLVGFWKLVAENLKVALAASAASSAEDDRRGEGGNS